MSITTIAAGAAVIVLAGHLWTPVCFVALPAWMVLSVCKVRG